MKKFLHVLGYGWSGSSAVIDLLKEFDCISVPNLEFRLIKERYGLNNLESMLTDQWDPIETDIAIKDFLWLTKKLNEKISRFYIKYGHCYSQTIGNHFLFETEKFINDLIDYKFKSSWHFFYWKFSPLKRIYFWFRKKLGLSDYSEIMYFTSPMTKEAFEEKAKNYINNLFEPIVKTNDEYVVLDQGVQAHFPENAFKYTSNAKVIVIDRDPRDVYVDLVKCKELIGAELSQNDNADMFIQWYKSLHFRSNLIDSNEILFLNFENIVLNYEDSVNKIMNFLNLTNENHINKLQFFNPQISKKNIGLWKQYKNQEVMNLIKQKLPEFCYE